MGKRYRTDTPACPRVSRKGRNSLYMYTARSAGGEKAPSDHHQASRVRTEIRSSRGRRASFLHIQFMSDMLLYSHATSPENVYVTSYSILKVHVNISPRSTGPSPPACPRSNGVGRRYGGSILHITCQARRHRAPLSELARPHRLVA